MAPTAAHGCDSFTARDPFWNIGSSSPLTQPQLAPLALSKAVQASISAHSNACHSRCCTAHHLHSRPHAMLTFLKCRSEIESDTDHSQGSTKFFQQLCKCVDCTLVLRPVIRPGLRLAPKGAFSSVGTRPSCCSLLRLLRIHQ